MRRIFNDGFLHSVKQRWLSASIIEKRLNYWSWLLCPKFSEKDREAVNLQREYSFNACDASFNR